MRLPRRRFLRLSAGAAALLAVFRMALENVRQPDAQMPNFPFGLTMGMMLSTPMLLVGLFLIWRGMREPMPPALPQEQPPAPAPLTAKGADEPA